MNSPIAGAWVFSGRKDPEWFVSSEFADELFSYWETLPVSDANPFPQKLGYRGCYLSDAGKKLETFGGIVKYIDSKNTVQWRKDANKQIETLLLKSAPEGMLPSFVVENF